MEAAAQIDSPEKQEALRQVLFDTFCQQYHSLATFIQRLPLNAEMKTKIALFMDTAFLWTKEAFVLANVEAKRSQLAEVKAEAPADETVAAVPDVALPNE